MIEPVLREIGREQATLRKRLDEVSEAGAPLDDVRWARLFDEAVDGRMPSDHDGVLVRYRLSWSGDPG